LITRDDDSKADSNLKPKRFCLRAFECETDFSFPLGTNQVGGSHDNANQHMIRGGNSITARKRSFQKRLLYADFFTFGQLRTIGISIANERK